MTLRQYLYSKQMTMLEFSKIIGYHPAYVSQVIRGTLKPGKMFRYRVEMLTEGKVKQDEISDEHEKKTLKNLVV